MNTIALSKINLKAPTQLRSSGEDMSHVEDLAHSFADTGSFKELPWVALIKDTNEYVPIDGFHRLTALQWLAEQEDSECQVDLDNVSVRLTEFDSMSEAIVAAAGVNANHGLKRKSTDIQNAIQKLLEVDRIGFSKTKYTLDSDAIMKVVNCSSATYRRATEEIRRELTEARDIEIKRLSAKGVSNREIAQRVYVSAPTVSAVLASENVKKCSVSKSLHKEVPQDLSESKRSVSNMTHGETLDGSSVQKRHSAKIAHTQENEGVRKCSMSESLHKEPLQDLRGEKPHDGKTSQDYIQKRKANLIESITRQLKALSVEQLKSVDGHIATVSDF